MYLVENTKHPDLAPMIHASSIYRDVDIRLHLKCEREISSSSMSRQSSDPATTAACSSIALLRERFRELERAKAMRQQREQMRLLSQAQQVKAAASEVSRLFSHPETIVLRMEPVQGSIYCKSAMHNQDTDLLQVIETPSLASSSLVETAKQSSDNSDESDVDTSLHL